MKVRILALAASVAVLGAWSTPKHPVKAAASVTYVANMNGASETPATTSKGTGTATFVLSGTRLRYTITVADLTGPATMAHIHIGAVGVAGPPAYTFKIKNIVSGTLAKGSIDLTKEVGKGVSGDSLKALIANGNAYVNVHTKANPGGEIRGQVEKK
ncbi:MAG TPA: CHRD domain-containing protein [Gemmatimonadaceae bacterium]